MRRSVLFVSRFESQVESCRNQGLWPCGSSEPSVFCDSRPARQRPLLKFNKKAGHPPFFFRWGDDKTGEVVSVDIAITPITKRGGALQAPCKVGQFF
jgi:hypothetical protein